MDKNEIQLFWPEAKEKVDHYIVKYRIKGSKKEWAEVEVKKVTKKLKLNYGETYEFNVFVVVDGKTKAYTQPKDVKIPKGKLGILFLIRRPLKHKRVSVNAVFAKD